MPHTVNGGGQGADVSFKGCTQSFDGLSTCGANDTFFVNSHVGDKGGAVTIQTWTTPSYIEFTRCTVDNSSAGLAIEDDPQGEGGAFSVVEGATLVLTDCVIRNNHCGSKVCFDIVCDSFA